MEESKIGILDIDTGISKLSLPTYFGVVANSDPWIHIWYVQNVSTYLMLRVTLVTSYLSGFLNT